MNKTPFLCIPSVDIHTPNRTLTAGKMYVVKHVRTWPDDASTVVIDVGSMYGEVHVSMDAFVAFFRVQKKKPE